MTAERTSGPEHDSRPIRIQDLTDGEKEAIGQIHQRLEAIRQWNLEAPRAKGSEQIGQLPWAQPDLRRIRRVIALDGMRGSGKTSLLLTLLQGWLPDGRTKLESGAEYFFDANPPFRALPPLDFDPLPAHLHPYVWLVQAMEPLVHWLEQRAGSGRWGGEQRSTVPSPWSSETEPNLRQLWQRLHKQALISWNSKLLDTKMAGDLDEFVADWCERSAGWQGLGDQWRQFLDRLLDELERHGALPAGGLLILPVDDLDLHPELVRDLLLGVRLMEHPRLVFLLCGWLPHARDVLEAQIGRGKHLKAKSLQDAAKVLARDLLDKVIPPANQIRMELLSFWSLLQRNFPEVFDNEDLNRIPSEWQVGSPAAEPAVQSLRRWWEKHAPEAVRQVLGQTPVDEVTIQARATLRALRHSRLAAFRFRDEAHVRSWVDDPARWFAEVLKRGVNSSGQELIEQLPEGRPSVWVVSWKTLFDRTDRPICKVAEDFQLRFPKAKGDVGTLALLALQSPTLIWDLRESSRLLARTPRLGTAPWFCSLLQTSQGRLEIAWPTIEFPQHPHTAERQFSTISHDSNFSVTGSNDLDALSESWLLHQLDWDSRAQHPAEESDAGGALERIGDRLEQEDMRRRSQGEPIEQSWWLRWMPLLAAPEFRLSRRRQAEILGATHAMLENLGLAGRQAEIHATWVASRSRVLTQALKRLRNGTTQRNDLDVETDVIDEINSDIRDLLQEIRTNSPDAPWYEIVEPRSPGAETILDWGSLSNILSSQYGTRSGESSHLAELLSIRFTDGTRANWASHRLTHQIIAWEGTGSWLNGVERIRRNPTSDSPAFVLVSLWQLLIDIGVKAGANLVTVRDWFRITDDALNVCYSGPKFNFIPACIDSRNDQLGAVGTWKLGISVPLDYDREALPAGWMMVMQSYMEQRGEEKSEGLERLRVAPLRLPPPLDWPIAKIASDEEPGDEVSLFPGWSTVEALRFRMQEMIVQATARRVGGAPESSVRDWTLAAMLQLLRGATEPVGYPMHLPRFPVDEAEFKEAFKKVDAARARMTGDTAAWWDLTRSRLKELPIPAQILDVWTKDRTKKTKNGRMAFVEIADEAAIPDQSAPPPPDKA